MTSFNCRINAPGEQAVVLSILFNCYRASRAIGLDLVAVSSGLRNWKGVNMNNSSCLDMIQQN